MNHAATRISGRLGGNGGRTGGSEMGPCRRARGRPAPRRARTIALGFLVFAVVMHGLAYLLLSQYGNLAGPVDTQIVVVIAGTLLMTLSLMLSQAIESVTRAFYARGDLELILTSPAVASRLFAVRIVAMAVTTLLMTLTMGAMMPAVSHVGVVPGGGVSRIRQRRQAVSPGTMVIV